MGLLLLLASPALASSTTWSGGCGANTSWSCAENWSGGAVPKFGDKVIFNSTSTGDSTVDPAFAGEVASVSVSPGYTGTISLARSLVVANRFTQESGGFTATNQALDLSAVELLGGSFTASSGTTSIGKDLTIGGSAGFNANGGTVAFDGASGTLSCGNRTFNHVAFTHEGGTKRVGGDCSLPLGANPTIDGENAAIVLDGTLTGSGTLTIGEEAGRLTLDSSGALSGFSGADLKSLAVNGAGADFGGYSPFTVGNAYVQTGGTVTAPPGAKFAGPFTVGAGSTFDAPHSIVSFGYTVDIEPGATFNANSGTVNFTGTRGGSISCGNQVFHLVTFTHSGNNRPVGSDCTLPLGTNPVIGGGPYGGINLSGTLTGKGKLTTAAGASLILSEGYALNGFGKLQPYSLAVNSGTADLGEYESAAMEGSLLVRPEGTLVAPGRLNVGGNMTVEPGGGFEANGGTVVLSGTDQAISGSIAFNNLVKTTEVAATLAFEAGEFQTIEGSLTLKGSSAGSLLSLVSSSPGSEWLIEALGTTAVRFASIADSTNVGPVIAAHSSVDGGGNTGWSF